MLTRWRLNRFKSVTERTDLRVAPLTVFTGANSAGKSTIIQSMLLTAQTMQSPVYSRPVVLNGHMSRLGSFTDLVSGGDDDLEISIGFDIASGAGAGARLFAKSPFMYRRGDAVEQISVQFSFSSRPGPNDREGKELLVLQPSLIESSIEVSFQQDGRTQKESIHIRRSPESILDKLRRLQLSGNILDEADIDTLRYDVVKESRKGQSSRSQETGVKTDSVGCALVHFLPRNVSVRFDQVSAEVNAQLATIIEPNSSYGNYGARHAEGKIPEEAANYIVELLRNILAQNEESTGRHGLSSMGKRHVDEVLNIFSRSRDLGDIRRLYKRLPGRDISFIFTVLGSERTVIEKLLRGSRGASLALQSTYTHDQVQQGTELVHYYFRVIVNSCG